MGRWQKGVTMAQYDEQDEQEPKTELEILDFADEVEGDDPDIEALLNVGYEQLDGFAEWLEASLGLDTRTAQQDCFNAEALIDYLANQQRKAAADINEFELRWFLFSHYIRKAMADAETEERLPDSLRRFFTYLSAEHGYAMPSWMQAALDERPFYLARRQAYADLDSEDEREWEEGFRAWCAELEDDLDTRALWLPRDMGEGMDWGDIMGWREATLQEEANQLWQEERQTLLDDGMDYETARSRLLDSYYLWLDTPQERLEGATPREIVLDERRGREDPD